MIVPDATGHSTIQWDPDTAEGRALAARAFDRLAAEGKIAFAPPADDPAGEPTKIVDFDPSHDAEVIWLRPIAGG